MNHLKHIDEFRSLLTHYRMSPEAEKVLAGVRLVLLLAPSSGGRNTIIRELVKTGKYHFIISDTTRRKRVNDGVLEQDGVEYWFRTEAEVLEDIKAGRYIEAEVIHGQQVSGVNIAELERVQKEHRVAISDVDLGGAHYFVTHKPDTLAIMVLPPSFEEWMRRMKARGEMTPEEFKRRLQTAEIIFGLPEKRHYFQFVINDTVKHATQQLEALEQGEVNESLQQAARQLVKKLKQQTSELLATL
ncbi:MAG TPA: hypothetical protein VFZ58_00025 [Candidatus Saccharimonadales bacterium]